MDSKALKSLVAGSAFGFALTKATVFPPTVIIDQLLLRNMHMLRVFLTATSISTYESIYLCHPHSYLFLLASTERANDRLIVSP